jgi:hypothetical protein
MKHEVKIGQTDYTVLILIRDSSTGAPKTELTFESAGIDVCYTRVETDNDVVLTAGAPVTTTLTGAHTDWGFVKVDDTNAPGLYKLDIADEVFATGAWSAVVSLICTGCDPVHIEFVLVPEAPYSRVAQTGDAYAVVAHADYGNANLLALITNKRGIRKESSTWYLYVRNAGDDDDILKKALKDKDGNDITDIAAGVIASELASSV